MLWIYHLGAKLFALRALRLGKPFHIAKEQPCSATSTNGFLIKRIDQ